MHITVFYGKYIFASYSTYFAFHGTYPPLTTTISTLMVTICLPWHISAFYDTYPSLMAPNRFHRIYLSLMAYNGLLWQTHIASTANKLAFHGTNPPKETKSSLTATISASRGMSPFTAYICLMWHIFGFTVYTPLHWQISDFHGTPLP